MTLKAQKIRPSSKGINGYFEAKAPVNRLSHLEQSTTFNNFNSGCKLLPPLIYNEFFDSLSTLLDSRLLPLLCSCDTFTDKPR